MNFFCTNDTRSQPEIIIYTANDVSHLKMPVISCILNANNGRYADELISYIGLWARSPYSIAERRVPELISVLGSQPAGDVSHKPGGRLALLSARPAVTLATLKRAATNFAVWWTEARWVWIVCLRQLPDSVAAAIWTQSLLCHIPQSPCTFVLKDADLAR